MPGSSILILRLCEFFGYRVSKGFSHSTDPNRTELRSFECYTVRETCKRFCVAKDLIDRPPYTDSSSSFPVLSPRLSTGTPSLSSMVR